jgi:hypothetical protein
MSQKMKPWTKIGISRATWYRHNKPTTKPQRRQRMTQPQIAKALHISVRSMQRTWRVLRLKPEFEPMLRKGEVKSATIERLLLLGYDLTPDK